MDKRSSFAVAVAKNCHGSPSSNSIAADDLLGAMLDDMWSGRPVNPLSRWWFERGVLRSIRRGESLDSSLGLSGAGLSCLQARLLLIQRNGYLAAAADSVALDSAVTQWQRCVRLADEAAKFMVHTWPITKRLSAPPEEWHTFKKHLWHAACTDLDIPTSARGIRYALQQNAQFSLNGSGAKLLAQYL